MKNEIKIYSTYHNCSSLWINSKILVRNNVRLHLLPKVSCIFSKMVLTGIYSSITIRLLVFLSLCFNNTMRLISTPIAHFMTFFIKNFMLFMTFHDKISIVDFHVMIFIFSFSHVSNLR